MIDAYRCFSTSNDLAWVFIELRRVQWPGLSASEQRAWAKSCAGNAEWRWNAHFQDTAYAPMLTEKELSKLPEAS